MGSNGLANQRRRIESDVVKMMSNYEVNLKNDNLQEFFVVIDGPKDTPYYGGSWRVRVELPDNYPYKSPSIGFMNRIYHPNIDEKSGSVCLDVINQSWSPMYDLMNIFDTFLPQLLSYPNASDPLNGDAAALLLRNPKEYEKKIRDYVELYAKPENGNEMENDENEEHEMSSVESDDDDEDMN